MTAIDRVELYREGQLPSFDGATAWINSDPLTPAGLRGHVVVVEFWTFTCINWLRTLPYVRAWDAKYREQGLVVIGVHTPEFSFEHDLDNIRRATRQRGIEYPVAVDNDYEVWRAFDNHYWPALYFADTDGTIRHHRFGEGHYEQSERVIQRLLTDSGVAGVASDLVSVDDSGVEAPADWDDLRTPETYLGYERTEGFASSRPVFDEPHEYAAAERLQLNEWGLTGNWTMQADGVVLNEAGGTIAHRSHARDVNLVMGRPQRGSEVRFRVMLDGEPPRSAHGLEVDDEGNGTASEQRLYQLVRQPAPIADRTVEITFDDPGIKANVFTFG